MLLDPLDDGVDQILLFTPRLYDREEFAFLRKHLCPGETFIDVGAHIGTYKLYAASLVSSTGQVVAIEADPHTHALLAANIQLNAVRNIKAICGGVK